MRAYHITARIDYAERDIASLGLHPAHSRRMIGGVWCYRQYPQRTRSRVVVADASNNYARQHSERSTTATLDGCVSVAHAYHGAVSRVIRHRPVRRVDPGALRRLMERQPRRSA